MSTSGFRSAELGAPASFTRTTTCKPGCSAQSDHAADCAMMAPPYRYRVPVTLVYPVQPPEGAVFTIPAGGFTPWLAAMPATCPHCGGDLLGMPQPPPR